MDERIRQAGFTGFDIAIRELLKRRMDAVRYRRLPASLSSETDSAVLHRP
jgi:hypothetical protein